MPLTKVTTNGLTDESITTTEVADGGLANVDFAPGTLTNAKLAGSIANAKLANESITINSSATALGASIDVGKIAWQSVVVSDGSTVTTMVAGRGYFVNNSSAAGIVKLPASGSAGDTIIVKDYAGNFGTNSLTVQRNGHNIQGVANDQEIKTNRAAVTYVYIDSTKGWLVTVESNVSDLQTQIVATGGTITTSGDEKIHTFTGDGNFVVSALGPNNTIDYLVLAGGGGGGNRPGEQAGGGGGGGLRSAKTGNHGSYTVHPNSATSGVTISAATFPITVGGGGAAPGPGSSASGSNSVFSTITSAGGGRGGEGGTGSGQLTASTGGSGGGGGWGQAGASGNTPPVSPPQGGDGGAGNVPSAPSVRGGAGGGSGRGNTGTDLNVPGNSGGGGATGANNHITGSPVVYGSGGGGGGLSNPTWNTSKGPGGTNAADGADNGSAATSATANRGGGGGGASGTQAGSAGASGVVIIRYKFQ